MSAPADKPLIARDQDVRDEIVASGGRSLLVEAAAGTGKTTLLVDRILRCVCDGRISLARTVAITFTEKAAAELEARLRRELTAELARPDLPAADRAILAAAAAELDRAAISTIHGFCARILRERAVDAGVDPEFAVLDAAGADLLRQRCWQSWLQEQVSSAPPELTEVLRAGVSADSLQELAFAIAGSPEVIDDLHESLVLPAEGLDYLTQQVRQAVPEAARTCAQGLTGRTNEHSRAWLRLTRTMVRRADDDEALRRSAYALAGVPVEKALTSFAKAERDAVATALEPLAGAARRVGAYVATLAFRFLVGFVRHYRSAKRARSVLDFQDLLLYASRMLRDDPALRAYFQRRFDAVFVDEFQDTDPLQAELVAWLCEDPDAEPAASFEGVTLAPGKLFAVGDPKQSIYRFRRADVQIYDRFKGLFLGPDADRSGLRRIACNFRSVPELLNWCNDLFEVLLRPDGESAAYQAEHVPLEAPRGAAPAGGPAVVVICPPPSMADGEWNAETSRRHEARFIAHFIREAGEGRFDGGPWQWGHFAFLLRSLTDVDIYAEALRGQGIPYRIVGGRHFYQREQIVEALALLQAVDDPLDEAAIVAALRSSFLGFSDEDLLRHRQAGGRWNYLADHTETGLQGACGLLRLWHGRRNRVAPHVLLREILAATGAREAFLRKPAGRQRAANLDKFADHLRLLWPAAGNFGAVVRHLSALQEAALPEEESAAVETGEDFVQLMSMHKAKGLQFRAVVLPDLGRGLGGAGGVPPLVLDRVGHRAAVQLKRGLATTHYEELAEAEVANEKAENRRLLYVACTRAERLLVLPMHWQASRSDPDSSFQAMLAASGRLAPPQAVPFGTDVDGAFYLDTGRWAADATPTEAGAAGGDAGEDAGRLLRAREQWVSARTSALERSFEAARFVLPSSLDVEHIPAQLGEEPGIGGREFGTLFHNVLAEVPLRHDDRGRLQALLHGLARGEAGRLEMDARAAAEAAELALAALANPEFAGLLSDLPQVEREVPFAVPLERLGLSDETGRGLAEGSIDLLLSGEAGRVVVDYKTDRVSPGSEGSLAATYWPQLALYALAVGACRDVPVPDVALFFVRTGVLLRHAVDERLRRAVADLAASGCAV